MAARPGEIEYILLNESSDTYETFASEEELQEFLEEEGFDEEELESLRVIEASTEYTVTPSYKLEEVE